MGAKGFQSLLGFAKLQTAPITKSHSKSAVALTACMPLTKVLVRQENRSRTKIHAPLRGVCSLWIDEWFGKGRLKIYDIQTI